MGLSLLPNFQLFTFVAREICLFFHWTISSEPKFYMQTFCEESFPCVKVRRCFWGCIWWDPNQGLWQRGKAVQWSPGPLNQGWVRWHLGRGSCLAKCHRCCGLSVAWKKKKQGKPLYALYDFYPKMSCLWWILLRSVCIFLKASRHCGVPDCISQKLTCSLYPTLFFLRVEFF